MKNWKKFTLAFLIVLMLCLASAAAEGEYPESAHPYENNTDQSWEYVYPESADYLKVTFSDDTATESGYDYVIITDANGGETRYSGAGLAGETVYLPGGSFTIRLTSDGSVAYYGFRITQIAAASQDEYDEYINRPRFTVTNNGLLTGYSGPNDVVVPEQVDGKTVTAIGSSAFQNSSVVTVQLPDTILYIGDYAFKNCTSLTSVNIPSGVTSIGYGVFYGCELLTEINIPSGLTSIGEYAFYRCTSLTKMDIPSGVTSIGYNAFSYCNSLTSVNIPSSVTSIGTWAFSYCTSLTSVDIPSGVTSIGYGMFYGCESLTEINIPSGVTSIGYDAFGSCHSLTSVNIPSSVTSIGKWAFSYCTSLTSVSIPSGVTSIEKSTFEHCTSLTSVNILSGVTSIGECAFQGCLSLTEVNIPSSVTDIGKQAFHNCVLLTSVSIPSGVTSIGEYAFEGNTVLLVGSNAYARQYAIDNGYQYISDTETVTWEGVETVDEKIDWIISNYLTDGMSEYQRALKLYDWLCAHVAYDNSWLKTGVSTGEHGVGGAGALLDGWAVCHGYAQAYEWLLEAAGIQVFYVSGVARGSGEGHAWNLAKIDGKWYQFDATWDESGNGSWHNYFALTDAAMETDHRRDDYLSIRCNSWAANYKFRNGEYDQSLAQLRNAVEEKLQAGTYTTTIRCDTYWQMTDKQMLADILASESWSVAGRLELSPESNGRDYTMTFYPNEVPVTSITLNGVEDDENYCMYPGYTAQLEAVTEPAGAAVRFVSLNENIITVDENGLVTAVATGSTEVQAIAGNAVYRLPITVVPEEDVRFFIFFQGIDGGYGSCYLDVGENRQAICDYWHKLLLDHSPVQLTSDDDSIATVDENGLVTAVGYGTTTIRAEWLDKTAVATVIVRRPVTAVTMEKEIYETVADGSELWLYASIECADPAAYYRNFLILSWCSGNEAVLNSAGKFTWKEWNSLNRCYSFYGWQFFNLAPGVATVEAKARDGSGVFGTCTVVVHSATPMILPAALDRICEEAFIGSTAKEFVLPEGVTAIESRAFADCAELKLVNLPASVTEIADDAFEGCDALTLLCESGSAGAAYAARLGIPYVCWP